MCCTCFNCDVFTVLKAFWLCSKNRTGKCSGAGTHFYDLKIRWLPKSIPHIINCACKNCSEQWPNFARSYEITTPACAACCGIETVFAIQREVHEGSKRNAPLRRCNSSANGISGRRHRRDRQDHRSESQCQARHPTTMSRCQ